VAFSPDGTTLAAGITDGTVWMWNLADPAHLALIATLTGPQGHVFSLAFSPSGGPGRRQQRRRRVSVGHQPGGGQGGRLRRRGPGTHPPGVATYTYIPGVPYRAPC
jgi:hypothetical protein